MRREANPSSDIDPSGGNAGSFASNLERGRDAYARRAWEEACDALEAADRESPLELSDLDLLPWAAELAGRDEASAAYSERLYNAETDAGLDEDAAFTAFWLGFRLFVSRETARGSGWLTRAQRFAERAQGGSAIEGYLLLHVARRHLASAEHEAARDAARRALRIGERFGDRDLVMFARNFDGRILMQQGRIEEGLALLVLVGNDPRSRA